MTLTSLVRSLVERGVTLSTDGGNLGYRASEGALDEALLDGMREFKPALLAALQGQVGALPLTVDQAPLWFLHRLRGGSASDHLVHAFDVKGAIDTHRLRRAWKAVRARHAALRLAFRDGDAGPEQRVLRLDELADDGFHVASPVRDDATLDVELAARSVAAFDLSAGDTCRLVVIPTSTGDHVLLFCLHHLVGDGHSFSVIFDGLSESYADGREARVWPALDWIALAGSRMADAVTAEPDPALLDRLRKGPTVLELPTDRRRPAVQDSAGARVHLSIDGTLRERLVEAARKARVSSYMQVVAALTIVLRRHFGSDRLVLGTPVSLRDALRTANGVQPARAVGMAVNACPLLVDAEPDTTSRELLTAMSGEVAALLRRRDVPLARTLAALGTQRDPSRNPIFQVLLQLSALPGLQLEGCAVSYRNTDPGTAQFDLSLHLFETDVGLQGFFEYDTHLFERARIERLATHFELALRALIDQLDAPIGSIELLTGPERELYSRSLCAPVASMPATSFDGWLADVTRATPELPCAESASETLTLGELDLRVTALARRLRRAGAGPGAVCGVYTERGIGMLVALLAAMRCRAAMLPLDPRFPRARLQLMLSDSGAGFLLSDIEGEEQLDAGAAVRVPVDAGPGPVADIGAAGEGGALPPLDPPREEDLAYILYTSGSTGTPKGVEITNGSLVAFLSAARQRLEPAPGARLLAITTLSFDIAILELLLPLVTGGVTVVADHATARDGERLGRTLVEARIDALQATPSTWRMLLASGHTQPRPLVKMVGGEALDASLARSLLALDEGPLWNLYGPTEATVWVAARRVRPENAHAAIGEPLAGCRLLVLGPDGAPLPIGVPGELALCGRQVARGYRGRESLTAERFVEVEHPAGNRSRAYRTGDRVRLRADGLLDFEGRMDNQLKLRGHRLEAGEIEHAIVSGGLAGTAVVGVVGEQADSRALVAWLEIRDGTAPSLAELRKRLADTLPSYMLPEALVCVDAWPLTPNRKIDRAALPPPEAVAGKGSDLDRNDVPGGDEDDAGRLRRRIAAAWQQLLPAATFGLDDNFFDVGGHSLLIVQLRDLLERDLGIAVSITDLFSCPTVAQMAALAGNGVGGSAGKHDHGGGSQSSMAASVAKAAARARRQREATRRVARGRTTGSRPS